MAKYNAAEFITIEIQKLKGDAPIPFDLYILMPINQNIVRVKAQSDILDQSFLARCNQHGRTTLYIHKTHEEFLLSYLKAETQEKIPDPISENATPATPVAPTEPAPTEPAPSVSAEPIPDLAESAGALPTSSAMAPSTEASPSTQLNDVNPDLPPEQLMSDLLSDQPKTRQDAMASAKAMVEKILEQAPDSPDKKAVLEILNNALNEHSSSVAVYAALFSMGLKYKDQSILQDLIKAALLHDIGISQISPRAYQSPEKTRTPEDAKLMIAHVSEGIEVAKELGINLSPRQLVMLQAHHEKFDGTGYPQNLEGFKLDEFGQILSLADFVSNACQGRWDGSMRTLDESFVIIAGIEKETTFPHYLNPMLFKKIMGWVKQGCGKDYLDKATNIVQENKSKLLEAG